MTLAFAPERIEQWPLARLQPYAKNAKLHGPDQVAKIAASMAEARGKSRISIRRCKSVDLCHGVGRPDAAYLFEDRPAPWREGIIEDLPAGDVAPGFAVAWRERWLKT
jgi:hypothetical protein